MPSAEETTYLIEVMPPVDAHAINHQSAFSSHDVDLLVSRVKENLRLTNLKSRSSRATHRMRKEPYRLHSNSWSDMDKPKFDKQKLQLPPAPTEYYNDDIDDELENDDRHHHNHYRHSHSNNNNNNNNNAHNQRHGSEHFFQLSERELRRRAHLRKRRAALDFDDSYERLQALLRQGALIKEAVKRLQTNEEQEDDDVMSDEEDGSCESRKKRATSTSATNTTLDSMDDDDDDDEDEDRLSNLYPTHDL